jgi:hypothetical protein
MTRKFALIAVVAFLSAAVLASQEASKPQIGSVTVLPSDPIVPTGDCRSSTAGYLEKMTEKNLGVFVSKSLHDGYIVTVYPATKSGIFVAMQCTNTMPTAKP